MAPSVDSAGRRFPVIAGLRGLDKPFAQAAAERCEEALFDAVSKCWSVDQLEQQLSSAVIPAGSGKIQEGWWPKQTGHALLSERHPPTLLGHVIGTVAGIGA